jgi:hypothetical protein
MSISDEELMAYVDGESDADARIAVEAAAAADPHIAARIERHRALRHLIGDAYGDALHEAVPRRLLAAARAPSASAPVIDLAEARARRRGLSAWAMAGAMAACLAVGLILGQELNLAGEPALIEGTANGPVARDGLDRALNDQLAARQAGQAVQVGISFRSTDGRYCRTFQTSQGHYLAGVACRDPKAWVLRLVTTISGEPKVAGNYSMAASPLPAPVADFVDQTIMGDSLDAAGEARAKSKGWRD